MKPILSDFEYNVALQLCVFGYETRKTGESYLDFKVNAIKKYNEMGNRLSKVGTLSEPHIDFDDDKIRCIVTNFGKLVFICITGSSTTRDHMTNMAIASTRIHHDQVDADAPVSYNCEARDLGIGNLIRALLRNNEVEKIVICGHSRGGSIAHVVHYSLLINTSDVNIPKEKITSVAFGSTPFLKSHNPICGKRFLTYYTATDIVPALFAAATPIADRLQVIHQGKLKVLEWVAGVNIEGMRKDAGVHVNKILSEYLYFGNWIKLCKSSNENAGRILETRNSDPVRYYQGTEFEKGLKAIHSFEDIKTNHGIKSSYERYLKKNAAPPSFDEAESQSLWVALRRTAAQHLMPPNMSHEALPVRLNRGITAAVVTKSFGDNTIYECIKAFGTALEKYLLLGRALMKNDQANVASDMKSWSELMTLLDNISPTRERTGNTNAVHTFNASNIGTGLNGLIVAMTLLVAENFIVTKSPNVGKIVLFSILGTASCVALAATGLGAIAAAALIAEVGTVAVGATGIFAGASVLSGFGTVASFRHAFSDDKEKDVEGLKQLSNRVKAESFRTVSSLYVDQLKTMAVAAMGPDASTEAPRELEQKLSTLDVSMIKDPKLASLLCAFKDVMKSLVELDNACKNLIFIVLHGQQGVGKSWFIQSINRMDVGPRVSTNEPVFVPYTPSTAVGNGGSCVKVFLVDMPGGNSLSPELRQFETDLYGIGSIGISLVMFDVRPPQLPATNIRNVFGACDSVLVCLNKVTAIGMDLAKVVNNENERQLVPIIEAWRAEFERSGIYLAYGNANYSIMATEMYGSNSAPGSNMDADELADLARLRDRNLTKVTANGGQTRSDVVGWIDEQIKQIICARERRSTARR
ncbi:hypothetical protein ACHHYP_00018 [Achlya hypogyna]|uniref:Fungal lipase-type domain-containing protein n=1 Tax=Achlya hypogyna TaxID=1202772 RepID=A0A1V9ZCY8_ACHHY|nr:hypothetical protein ACHHYP_00018 [Achlya hypogyna]